MTYKYLYQDKQNRNCEGEIKAWDRNDAYLQLRKQGIRPYRVIGDDPLNWRPWAIAAGYAVLLALVFVLAAMLAGRAHPSAPPAPPLSADEAAAFRARRRRGVPRAGVVPLQCLEGRQRPSRRTRARAAAAARGPAGRGAVPVRLTRRHFVSGVAAAAAACGLGATAGCDLRPGGVSEPETKKGTGMLKGIDPVVSPELLKARA